ncbi:NfeD family protein [Cellulomonas timonensis]|uniref:NfeD family protein n=1 Tax=Cellulomonas timonensis TaxID=1689271 RepID=UPI00082BD702|nr:NfeD family protein [Cellulomonas timonensis]
MLLFSIIGGIGLLLLVVSLVLGEVFGELSFGDVGLSGSAVGIGAVVFGASGVIAVANDLPTVWTYAFAVLFAAISAAVAQVMINRLADGEDAPPPALEGAFGVLTATTGPDGGEVRLEGVRDLESRLAWSDDVLDAGQRVVVIGVSGSRVRVTKA